MLSLAAICIDFSFYPNLRLNMTLAVAEALSPNTPNQTARIVNHIIVLVMKMSQ